MDQDSFNLIDNVCEGLFMYNLSDPNLQIIPMLAKDFGTWDGSNYTINLRKGVKFHDNSTFTADDVVWTFNRLKNLMDLHKAKAAQFYQYFDPNLSEMRNIINKTIKINDYKIKFVLNTEYAPFEDLLCFEGSYIIAENSAPFNDTINKYTDDVIGTGPWNYQSYYPNVQVTFFAFKNYWRGAPYFNQLIFDVIPDSNPRR